MDRLRDVGRRGNLTAAGQASSLRRPRSSGGFKDPADEDESMEVLHSGRLRERPRKEGNMQSVSRLKRTRHSSRELHLRVEEMEETAGGDGCPIDEDDLPISPHLLSKQHIKLKFHGKVASDGAVAAESPAVPRKARTAISKRPYENNFGDGSRHQICTSVPRLSKNAIVSSRTLLGASLKPVKRMKHSSSKIKVAKLSKVPESAAISQQEVEVAEVLFDLAWMVSNMGSPAGNDEKVEAKTENSEMRGAVQRSSSPEGLLFRRQESVTTPQTSHSAVSSPVRGPVPMMSSHLSSTEGPTKKLSLLKMKDEDGVVSQLKEDTNRSVVDHKSAGDSCPGQSFGSTASAEVKFSTTLKIGQGSHPKESLALSTLALPSQSSVVADNNNLTMDAKSSASPRISITNSPSLEGNLKSNASLLKEFSEQKQHGLVHCPGEAYDASRLAKENTLKSSAPLKYEIDLMASPNASASGASEKTGNSVDFGLVPSKQTQNQAKDMFPDNQNNVEQMFVDTSVQKEKSVTGKEECAKVAVVAKAEHVEGDILKEIRRENQLMKVPKQEADPIFCNNANFISQQSANGSGWPGGMGYYPAAAAAAAAAVAAAWPATGSVIGQSSMAEKSHPGLLMPPLTLSGARPLYKHCAMHVYIAHFIDTQQQMQLHPVLAAAYGNRENGILYDPKSNTPDVHHLQPNALVGDVFTGLAGLKVNPQANNSTGLVSGLQNDKGSISATKEIVTTQEMNGCARKEVSQCMPSDIITQTTPLEDVLTSSSGYSRISQSTASLEIGAQNKGVLGSRQKGALGSCSEHIEVSAGATSNADSVSTAAAQVQYLQAIIQQTGFPFSFSSRHLMPPAKGHLPQQQVCPSSSHLYNLPFAQSQQNTPPGKGLPKVSSHQEHGPSMNREICIGETVSQPQYQQHQQHFSSALSSHSQQRNGPPHWHHFGNAETNLEGETVFFAGRKFPGYPKNMDGHEVCDKMHAANILSSPSLSSASQSIVLPTQVPLTARQMDIMKLPQSGQFQKQPPIATPYQGPPHGSVTNFQTAHTSSGIQMGSLTNNLVGPGPLGFASVAAVMAPQGHAVLQTMSDSQLSVPLAYQESCTKHVSSLSLDPARITSAHGMPDCKRLCIVEQGSIGKMAKENEIIVAGSSGYNSRLSSTFFPSMSSNLMNGVGGNAGSRQVTSVAEGMVPSPGAGRPNANASMTMGEPTLSRASSPSLLFHVPNAVPNQAFGHGQAACQYLSQAKRASRLHLGTTGVATSPSTLLAGSYTTVGPSAKQQSYLNISDQALLSSVQSRFPPTTPGPSSTSMSPSNSVSKAAVSAAARNIPGGKSSLQSLPKQSLAAPAKKPDMILTYLPGQVMGPSSITMSMGQALPQQQQHSQQQQMQHIMRQQQQEQQQQQQQQQQHHHRSQEQKQVLHQEHPQQSLQNAQQFHVVGLPPGASLPYQQAQSIKQSPHIGSYKQSISPRQPKQHLYQPPQHQLDMTESQHSTRMIIQSQQHSGVQNVAFASNCSVQQVSEVQPNRQQTTSSCHRSVPLGHLGTMSIVAPQTAPFSVGSLREKPTSSDGNLSQMSSPKAGSGLKLLGGINVSVNAPNMQRISNSSMGVSYIQGIGTKMVETKAPSQSSCTISYLPYLHSAMFSDGMPQGVKGFGASAVNAQSGVSTMNLREGSVISGHENSIANQQENEKLSPASKASAMSGLSACTSTVKSLSSLPILSTAPMALHCPSSPGQISQSCNMTSATMAADSVSTTG